MSSSSLEKSWRLYLNTINSLDNSINNSIHILPIDLISFLFLFLFFFIWSIFLLFFHFFHILFDLWKIDFRKTETLYKHKHTPEKYHKMWFWRKKNSLLLQYTVSYYLKIKSLPETVLFPRIWHWFLAFWIMTFGALFRMKKVMKN